MFEDRVTIGQDLWPLTPTLCCSCLAQQTTFMCYALCYTMCYLHPYLCYAYYYYYMYYTTYCNDIDIIISKYQNYCWCIEQSNSIYNVILDVFEAKKWNPVGHKKTLGLHSWLWSEQVAIAMETMDHYYCHR